MTYGIRQGARCYAWRLALIGLVIGLQWAGIGFNLWHDYRFAEQKAGNDAANYARAFDENINRTVEAVDQTLLFLRDGYQRDPAGFAGASWATGRVFLDNLRVQLAVANREGFVLWSNLGPIPANLTIADRTHFQVQQTSTTDDLYISRPVFGRLSQKWTVQFTRKLFAPDGSFAGIVVASLDPHYLTRFFESISIGQGSILLATTSGIVLARVPDREREPLMGTDLPADMLQRLLVNTTASYRAFSGIDHVDRIFSSHPLQRYPLILAVGLAAEDVFAPYRRHRRLYVAAGILLSIAGVVVRGYA